MTAYGVSNQRIANELGISRQAVARHRRRGMPCSSLQDALAWYGAHVDASRRRGTFSRLPHRPRPIPIDDDTRAALRFFESQSEAKPEPLRLDNFAPGFWGDDAPTAICKILAGEKGDGIKTKEDVCAAFSCISAAQRLHLRLMPSIMAKFIAHLRHPEAVEDALMEWSCAFAERWYGEDFESQPILPESVKTLGEFYQPF